MNEKILFTIVQRYLAPDLVKTTDRHNVIDAVTEQWRSHIELKCRDKHYPTLLMEQAKYKSMLAKAKAYGDYAPVYICSTPEGIYSFRMLELPNFKWYSRMLPATTEFANNELIEKQVTYLKLEWASRAYHLPAPGDTELIPFDVGSQAVA